MSSRALSSTLHDILKKVLVSAGCCVEADDTNTKVHQIGCRTKPVSALVQGARVACGDTFDADSTANYRKNGAVSQTERAGL